MTNSSDKKIYKSKNKTNISIPDDADTIIEDQADILRRLQDELWSSEDAAELSSLKTHDKAPIRSINNIPEIEVTSTRTIKVAEHIQLVTGTHGKANSAPIQDIMQKTYGQNLGDANEDTLQMTLPDESLFAGVAEDLNSEATFTVTNLNKLTRSDLSELYKEIADISSEQNFRMGSLESLDSEGSVIIDLPLEATIYCNGKEVLGNMREIHNLNIFQEHFIRIVAQGYKIWTITISFKNTNTIYIKPELIEK